MNSDIGISIIIPAYNYARYLSAAIHSVLNQSTPGMSVEIIIIDDGSTDDTPAVAATFGDAIRYVRKENQGLPAARNSGMAAATGDYIVFLDADDLLGQDCLTSHLHTFSANPDADISVCRNQMFRAVTPQSQLVPIDLWFLCKDNPLIHLCFLNIAPPHAFMIKTSAARKTGEFDTTLKACEDYDFWLRCAALGQKIAVNPVGMVFYRRHPGSMSAQGDKQLFHDVIMHKKMAALLNANQNFLSHKREEAWLAFASGCLFSARKSVAQDLGYAPELYGLCATVLRGLSSAKALGGKLAAETKGRLSASCEQKILDYYVHRAFESLDALADESHQDLTVVRRILRASYPEHQSVHKTDPDALWSALQKVVLPQEIPDRIDVPSSPNRQAGVPRKKILLVCESASAPLGTYSSSMEELGRRLVNKGYEVHMASPPDGGPLVRGGMHMALFRCFGNLNDNNKGEEYNSYKCFISHAEYDAAFFAGKPDSWIMAPLQERPLPYMHCYLALDIKVDDVTGASQTMQASCTRIWHHASGCLTPSESAFSGRLMREVGISPLVLPLPIDTAHEKLHAVNDNTVDDLALITAKDTVRADIIRAMERGIPWLAATEYDAVLDYAGGLACPPERLENIRQILHDNAVLRQTLGTLGKEHWQTRLSWEAVLPAFVELIENGTLTISFAMPHNIRVPQELLKAKFLTEQRHLGRENPRHPSRMEKPAPGNRADAHPSPVLRRSIVPPTTQKRIRISVVMATYNADKYLELALRSIKEQTYPYWEIIVQDGCSTDNTINILERHKGYVNYVSEPDIGIYDAWNKAVTRVSGEWVLFLGADDFLLHSKVFAHAVRYLRKLSEKIVYAYGVLMQGERGKINYIYNNSLHNTFHIFFSDMGLQFPGTFIRASFIKKHTFDTSYKIAGDFELAAKTASLDNVARIPLAIAYREMGGVSTHPEHARTMMQERRKILENCVTPRLHEFMAAALATVENQDHSYI